VPGSGIKRGERKEGEGIGKQLGKIQEGNGGEQKKEGKSPAIKVSPSQ